MRTLAGAAALVSVTMLLNASFVPTWNQPFPPHRVIGNIYYVGTNQLASFLVVTKEGSILINPSYAESVPLIKTSVEKLGFRFGDIKVILISHTHDDHCAGVARVKQMTGASLAVMDADVAEMQDGGVSDFHYRDQRWTPVKVDRVLHDGDEVRLGETTLRAVKTPGHTPGCTTWTTRVNEGGKSYDVVIVGSPNVNPGYRLVENRSYPAIASDYQHTFQVLQSLKCDVPLGAHGSYYDLASKFPKLRDASANPFVDPEGYRRFVADREQAFVRELKLQKAKVTGTTR